MMEALREDIIVFLRALMLVGWESPVYIGYDGYYG
jgi:hypothetical protein